MNGVNRLDGLSYPILFDIYITLFAGNKRLENTEEDT